MIARARIDGVFAEKITLTPALAQEILKNNPDNRTMRTEKRGQLIRDIEAGRWLFNGEPILISEEGWLNDGQHRVSAVLITGRPIETLIVFGLSRASRLTLDIGSKRNAGDFLHMLGIPNALVIAAIGRLLLAYEESDGKLMHSNNRISATAIFQRFVNDEKISASAIFAQRHARRIRDLTQPAVFGACHFLFSRRDHAKAEVFLDKVAWGVELSRHEPAYMLREALIFNDRLRRAERTQLMFAAWNAHLRGEEILMKMAPKGTDLPPLA